MFVGIIVDEMNEEKHDHKYYQKRFEKNGGELGGPWFPQNYETCVHFFRMFSGVVCFGMPIRLFSLIRNKI